MSPVCCGDAPERRQPGRQAGTPVALVTTGVLFNTPLFLYFFAGFFLLYGFVLRQRTPRVWLILVASLVFYAGWNYRFIPLLVLSAVVDYGVALALERAQGRERLRRGLVAVSVTTNLGILAAFKYSTFLLESVAELAPRAASSRPTPI